MQYYTLDTSKLSVKECIRFGGWGLPFLLLAKLFGHNLADNSVCASDLEELIDIEGQTLEKRAEDPILTKLRVQCEQEKLNFLFAYTIPPYPTKTLSLVYLSPTKSTLIELLHSIEETPHTTVVAITPQRSNKGEIVTGMYPRKKYLDPDPDSDVVVLKSGSIGALQKLHEARLHRSDITHKFQSAEEIREYIIARNQKSVQYFVSRGLYIPLNDDRSK